MLYVYLCVKFKRVSLNCMIWLLLISFIDCFFQLWKFLHLACWISQLRHSVSLLFKFRVFFSGVLLDLEIWERIKQQGPPSDVSLGCTNCDPAPYLKIAAKASELDLSCFWNVCYCLSAGWQAIMQNLLLK